MRKILLAGTAAAALGCLATVAAAQSPPPPANVVASGGQSWWGGTFSAYPSPTPEPATYQAYLRSRLAFDAGVSGDSYTNNANNKQQPFQFQEYARLYPAFAGTLANGMAYGAYMEIRQNSGGASATGGTAGNTLYWRREIGYVGGKWGSVRFGQGDNVLGYFMTGTFENTWGGSWNNDYPGYFNNANTSPIWPFADNSGDYGQLKIVYLTPQFAGLDAGISYQPNQVTSGEPQCSAALGASSSTCAPAISISSGSFTAAAGTSMSRGQLARQVNTVQSAVRYRGSAGPFALVATAGMHVGGMMADGGLTGSAASGGPKYQFQQPFMFDSGFTVSYGGLTVGGHFITGAVNPDSTYGPQSTPKGFGRTTDFIVGANYAFAQYLIQASYLVNSQPGAISADYAGGFNASTGSGIKFGHSHEFAIDVGGAYYYAPGCELDLTYLYGQRHQYGYSFLANAASTHNNNTRAQGLILTNLFTW